MALVADPWSWAAEAFDPTPDPYLMDPHGWVSTKTREHIWSKQVQIMESVRDNRRTAVQACHGPGKSFIAARAVAWWLDVHPPGSAIVVTSAPTWQQVQAILWREIRTAHRKGSLWGYVTQDCQWKTDSGDLVAFGRKPADHDEHGFQGIHAQYVLVILDEACGIPKQLFDAAGNLLTNDSARMLVIGNPDDPSSEFAKVCEGVPYPEAGFSRRGWFVIPISIWMTPNFTGEDVPADMRPMLPGEKWVEEKRVEWGEGTPLWVSKVEGRFPEDSRSGVIPWSWLSRCRGPEARSRAGELRIPIELGVDVGGSENGDRTVIRSRYGPWAGPQWTVQSSDPEVVAAKIANVRRETQAESVKFDEGGIGWGLRAVLAPQARMEGWALHPVNFGSASRDPAKYANLRAELWWEVGREGARQGFLDLSGTDENDQRLVTDATMNELAEPRYFENAKGQIQVEPKDDVRKRMGWSPDEGDALLLAYYVPPRSTTGTAGTWSRRDVLRQRR